MWETGEHLFWSRGRRREDAEMWREATAAAHRDHLFLFGAFSKEKKGDGWVVAKRIIKQVHALFTLKFFGKKITLSGLLN